MHKGHKMKEINFYHVTALLQVSRGVFVIKITILTSRLEGLSVSIKSEI